MIRSWMWILLGALLSVGHASPISAAPTAAMIEARQKINVSGRQRMLTQRMTAAACLTLSGADGPSRRAVARAAVAEFETALIGLAEGNSDLGLGREPNDDIRAALAEVSAVWRTFGPAILQHAAQDLHPVVVSQVLNMNMPMLTLSNAAVQGFVDVYGAEVIDADLAKTIDVAGRQRMLSQKMMKAACFVAVGVDVDVAAVALAGSMAMFDQSLSDLQLGNSDAGIVGPLRPDIARQLDKVAALWTTYSTALAVIRPPQPGKLPNLTDLAPLAAQSDVLLVEIDKSVEMYVVDR